jgi:hypothetical protein
LRKAAQRNPAKQAEYTSTRIEALRAKVPGLRENIAKRQTHFRKAQQNLATDLLQLKSVEAAIQSLELRIDDGPMIIECAPQDGETHAQLSSA